MTAPGFTGSKLDRADDARHDEAKLEAMLADPRARRPDLTALMPAPTADGGLPWVSIDAATDRGDLVLLGRLDGEPRFVALERDVVAMRRSPELMAAIALMRPDEAGLYAAARSIVDWHARNGFCGNCGTATILVRAGWGRHCPHCDAQHFPRVDPVVIMLAQHGEGAGARILVGRQPQFSPGMYSALAGFVEPGESIEEAVARELQEEAGIHVHSVRYVASQPWPFPSQLMIGCIGIADDDRLTVDRSELEDAMWVDRSQVRDALAGTSEARFRTPMPIAIARYLLELWASGGLDV